MNVPALGARILVVMDNCDSCLEMLQMLTEALPNMAERRFTLLHCIPTVYWEHGGDSGEEGAKLIRKMGEEAFRTTEAYFDQARSILIESGVPAGSIQTVTDCQSSDVTQATLTQLRLLPYSGVIVSHQHHHLVNQLTGRSLLRWLRRGIPNVTVWVVDEEMLHTG